MSKTLNKETHFGFETINEKEKAGRVQEFLILYHQNMMS